MLVSVIVLNLNGERVLPRCLDCLLAQSWKDLEILVVDNGSTDGSKELLRPYLADSRVRFIESDRNLGIAGGRNFGLRQARGEVVAFIDNDGYAAPDWIEAAVGELLSSSDIGAVGSLVLFASDPSIINGAGGTRNRQWYAGDLCFNEPQATAKPVREVLYPMGCGMVVRRDVMDRIGPFDEIAMRWYDDVELGIRIWRCGYRVVLAPSARIDHEYHHSGRAVQLPGWKRALGFEQLRIRTALKYQPAVEFLRWLGLEIILFGKTLFTHPRHAAVLVMAYVWNLAALPSALRIRRSVPCVRAVPTQLIHPSSGNFPPLKPESVGS